MDERDKTIHSLEWFENVMKTPKQILFLEKWKLILAVYLDPGNNTRKKKIKKYNNLANS